MCQSLGLHLASFCHHCCYYCSYVVRRVGGNQIVAAVLNQIVAVAAVLNQIVVVVLAVNQIVAKLVLVVVDQGATLACH